MRQAVQTNSLTHSHQLLVPSATMQLLFLTSFALATLASAYPKAATDTSTVRRAVPAHETYGFGGGFISKLGSGPTGFLLINTSDPNNWGTCIPFLRNTNFMRGTTSIRCVFFKYVVGFATDK
jgi:hypothetical protein